MAVFKPPRHADLLKKVAAGDLRAVLVHGSDPGGVSELSRRLVRCVIGDADDPMSVVVLDEETCKEDHEDSARDIQQIIRETLQKEGLRIAPDAMAALAELLGADRAASRGELEKLALYCMGREQVTLEDVRAVCGDVSGHAMGDMLDAFFSGNAKAGARPPARRSSSVASRPGPGSFPSGRRRRLKRRMRGFWRRLRRHAPCRRWRRRSPSDACCRWRYGRPAPGAERRSSAFVGAPPECGGPLPQDSPFPVRNIPRKTTSAGAEQLPFGHPENTAFPAAEFQFFLETFLLRMHSPAWGAVPY